jgi:hypothetical protein
MDRDEIAQHNSRVLQEAGEARTLGIETGPIDTDTLPFLRDEDGQTPLAPLFTISRSASTKWKALPTFARNSDR